jgi:catechol 2,3-dioxygenase-like lactoylglutathione lyase family enzyme
VKILTLHHVNLMVDDLEAANRFYHDVLGLPIRTDRPARMPPGTWFDVGDRRLSIAVGTPAPNTGQHFALVVDDLEAALPHLQASGVPLTTRRNPLLQVILLDPSGNEVELRQPPEAYAALPPEDYQFQT